MNREQKKRSIIDFFYQESDFITWGYMIGGFLTTVIWNLIFWQTGIESTVLINILIIACGFAVFLGLGVGICGDTNLGPYCFMCELKQLAFNLAMGLLSILIGVVLILGMKYGIASLFG